ncbi:MAG: 50S ribosomal protein L33 [Elusimicrobia bacterium ADurb.Bin231]|nr:MAG: 50S ribosomal protein L33 [Elusimicrobia bacterium ADurb.Bin231]
MREIVILSCQKCKQKNYTVRKNKKTMTEKIELEKYCRFCREHTKHKETK